MKKSSFTTIDRAIVTVDGFDKVKKMPEQQTALRGQRDRGNKTPLKKISPKYFPKMRTP